MRRSRIEEADLNSVAKEFGVPVAEVRRAVHSFFDMIVRESRTLPFDNWKKIYRKDKFAEYAFVRNIPYIGRIGPHYSRYLAWRRNEAEEKNQVQRSAYRVRYTQSDIENMAAEALAGRHVSFGKRKKTELYNQVWMVGEKGKTLAHQVIPKEIDNGIQD